MKRYLYGLRYLLVIHLVALLVFSIFRIILYQQGQQFLEGEDLSLGTRLIAFAKGLWFDNVVACYIMILPLIALSIGAAFNYYGKPLYRGVHIFFSTFYTITFGIGAANIPYFTYNFKHLNSSIFNWFEYTGATLGMMLGELIYILAILFFVGVTVLFVYLMNRWVKRTLRDIQNVTDEELLNWKIDWKINRKFKVKTTAYSLLLIGFCFLGIRGGLGGNSIRVSAAYYCNSPFLNQLGINPSFYLVRSTLDALQPEHKELHLMDEQKAITQVRQSLHITDTIPGASPIARFVDNEGESNGKNVVLVLLESMSADLMEHFGNTQNLTPFLDSIADNSLSFTQFFSSATHTNQAVHSTLYSYPALMKRHSMKAAVVPHFAGLPTILQDNGYHTMFFMTHEARYDNMNNYLSTNGFSEIYSQENYPSDKVVNSFGVQDDFLYEYTLGVLNQKSKEDKPFFATLLSVSNHPPYIIPDDFTPRNETEQLGVIEFSDFALSEFMAAASEQEWFDNTIFIFMGDHGKIVGAPHSDMPLCFHHIPFLIYSPSFIEPAQVESLGAQVDVAPTILGLLNVDYTATGFGINLLKESRDKVVVTSDDAIGCLDSTHFYIYKPLQNQEWLFPHACGTERHENINNDTLKQELRQYAFSILQSAQYLIKNELTGKHVGNSPR